MVSLREDEPPHRSFDIVVGQPEARAILAAWTGTVPARPSTWDLLVSSVAALGGRVERVVVTEVEEGQYFFATFEIERDGERRVLSARPSDAIAIALRASEAELLVSEEVMAALGMPSGGAQAAAPHEAN